MSSIATVTLHVNQDLGVIKDVDALQDELRGISGVKQVRMGTGTASHHLIIVDCDWNVVSTRDLLAHLTKRGLKAQSLG